MLRAISGGFLRGFLFLLLAGGLAAQSITVKEIVQRETPAIVSVYNLNTEGKLQGTGTGFIVRADGVIVTNYHVIRGAGSALIKLKNGEVYDRVTVIDFHPARDIAILKIAAMNLPVVTLGDSEKAEVGDEAIAIGNPKGLEHTVSDGLISAKRIIDGTQMLQISVPISPGSSGGPLYNRRGEVIGITTSGLAAQDAQNLNFAVSLKYVLPLLEGTARMTFEQVAAQDPASRRPAGGAAPAAATGESQGVRVYQDPAGLVAIGVAPGWKAGPGEVQGSIVTIKKDPSNLNVLYFAGFTDVKGLFRIGENSLKSSMKSMRTLSVVTSTTLDGRPFMGQHFGGKISGIEMRAYMGAMVTAKGGLLCLAFVPGIAQEETPSVEAMCSSMR